MSATHPSKGGRHNNRLRLAARGRSVSESLRRARCS